MRSCPQCGNRYEQGQFCPRDGALLQTWAPLSQPSGAYVEGRAHAPGVEEDLVGQVLADRFRIIRSLGQGGMGQVFEAQHLYIDKRVALKLLRPEITTSAEAVGRFQREAMAASTIGHENIVRIDDFGRLPDGRVYLTMEYLDGESLSALLLRGPLPLPNVLDITIQICRGLAAAHAKGIVHRDMKADNVFLCRPDGRVAILDFGIAKIGAHGSSNLTKTGAVFGTPNYMSPEQAMGQPVDHRADIYSLGVMLYEMLTGVVPFEAESFMGVLTRHITETPARPRDRAPDRDIPPDLEEVVLRAMAKKPDERFPDAESLSAALAGIRARWEGPETIPLRNPKRLPLVQRIAAPAEAPAGSRATAATPAAVTATAGEIVVSPVVQRATPPRRRWPLGLAFAALVAFGSWGVFAWRNAQRYEQAGAEVRADPSEVTSLAARSDRPAASHVARASSEAAGRRVKRAGARVGSGPAGSPDARDESARPDARLGDAAATVDVEDPGAPDAGPLTFKLVLASIPSGAAVFRGNEQLGETPDVFALPVEGGGVQLRLVRKGFRDTTVEVKPTGDQKLTVRLRSRSRARKPATGAEARPGGPAGEGPPGENRPEDEEAHDHGEGDTVTPGAGPETPEDDHSG